jgi:xanthine dehydrogenase YagS FAD-binding subunit
MRPFNHISPKSIDEAVAAIKKSGAVAIAGGGDLLGSLKDDIFPEYPKLVVNLKSIPGLTGITHEDGVLKIGALTTLAEISRNEVVIKNAKAIADAAGAASSPNLRETTTISGNICQLPHCWYFRKLGNRFNCARKGGEKCFAIAGDNRYHSAYGPAMFEFGGARKACIAACQSDLAPVLVALGAKLITTEREIAAGEFFEVGVLSATVLNKGEIIREIQIPIDGTQCRYKRFTFRKSIDFPVLSVTIAKRGTSYRIVLGGAAPTPYIAAKSEEVLNGNEITPELAEAAGEAAADGAKPYEKNGYKVHLYKTLLKRELLAYSDETTIALS